MADFEDRDAWDLPAWPEMYDILKQLQGTIVLSPPGPELNMMVFTMASLTAGCRHCQAHGAYGLDKMGVPMDKIRSIWSFETSDAFDDRERAALRFALAAGSVSRYRATRRRPNTARTIMDTTQIGANRSATISLRPMSQTRPRINQPSAR